MDIDNGIEVKVVFVQNLQNQVEMMFSTRGGDIGGIRTDFWDGNCKLTVYTCDKGTHQLALPMIQDGFTFIMKIYRSDKRIMIDIDGENMVELDTTSSSPPECGAFWGEGEINEVYFVPAANRNAATHYRILGYDNDGDNDDGAGGLTNTQIFYNS